MEPKPEITGARWNPMKSLRAGGRLMEPKEVNDVTEEITKDVMDRNR